MKKFFLFFSYLTVTFSLFAQPIIHVTPTGAGDNSGSSWPNAMPGTQLSSRVVSASAGTQFWVAAGTYKPTTTTDRTASFSIASGVSIYGGFAGTEIELGQRLKGVNETIFSGDIAYDQSSSEFNSQHIIHLYNTDKTTILDDLTISLGYTLSSDYGNSGAGIFVELTNSSLNLIVSNCRIKNNIVQGTLSGGGGIGIIARANSQCNITIKNCSFFSNYGGFGGAFTPQTLGGNITSVVEDCEFSSNLGFNESGAISNRYVDGSPLNSLTIRRCNFTNNGAFYRAGAITTGSSKCLVENSVFNGNVAGLLLVDGKGGAIDGSSSKSAFTNCLFINNKASYGGAIFSSSENEVTEQTFFNCTFTKDSATNSGGVFYNALYDGIQKPTSTYYNNTTKVSNCIIWQNVAPDAPVFKSQVSSASTPPANNFSPTYSLIQSNYPGVGNLNTDPLFVDATTGNFRLKPNSPAINAGDPNTVGLSNTDLAGQSRIQGGRVDIGAYEFFNCFGFPCLPFTVERKK